MKVYNGCALTCHVIQECLVFLLQTVFIVVGQHELRWQFKQLSKVRKCCSTDWVKFIKFHCSFEREVLKRATFSGFMSRAGKLFGVTHEQDNK